MRYRCSLAATLALIAAAACAQAPVYPAPPAPAASLAAREGDLDLSDYFSDGKRAGATDLYFAEWTGRFGLLGIVSAVTNLVSERARAGRMAGAFEPGGAFDLRARLKSQLAGQGATSSTAGGSDCSLFPLLAIQVNRDGHVRSALVIRVEEAKSGWVGFYFYHLDYAPDESILEESRIGDYFANLAPELDGAFPSLVRVVANDLAGSYTEEVPVQLLSYHFQQWDRIPFEALRIGTEGRRTVFRVNGKPALKVLPFVMGIHVFGANQFTLVEH